MFHLMTCLLYYCANTIFCLGVMQEGTKINPIDLNTCNCKDLKKKKIAIIKTREKNIHIIQSNNGLIKLA